MAGLYQSLNTDVLVVGGGGAGARAAIESALFGAQVVLSSKGPLGRSGITPLAQRSIEAALGHMDPRDNPEVHFEDIIREGRWLSDQDLAEAMAQDAPQRIYDLERYGTRMRKQPDGRFLQISTPGQSYPRSVMPEKGGHGMMLGLRRECLKHNNIDMREDTVITRLIADDQRITGALMLDMASGELFLVNAKAVIIATGGNEELWPLSDCPPESVGDGMFMAYEIGAHLVDMEQLLYYPQVVCHPAAVRGTIVPYEFTVEPQFCGGKLFNAIDEPIIPEGTLPARDEMITLIFNEIRAGRGTENGGVWLDLRASSKSKEDVQEVLEFGIPEIYRYLKNAKVDLLNERVEVAPAAHYTLGGIWIDRFGRTSIEGLWAAGEVAANVQGANRSSGNALAETQVFGARAGKDAAQYSHRVTHGPVSLDAAETEAQSLFAMLGMENGERPSSIKSSVKNIMGRYCAFPRTGSDLAKGFSAINDLLNTRIPQLSAVPGRSYNREWLEAIEVRSMAVVAKLVIAAASMRTESRGHHVRTDYPKPDDARWIRHTLIQKGETGMQLGTAPIRVTRIPVPTPERSAGQWPKRS